MNIFSTLLALALFSTAVAQTKPETSQNVGLGQVSSGMIKLFNTHQLVALGQWHDARNDQEILLQVIHEPEFAKKVRNVVIECGNSLYQSSLDRYVNGQDVPKSEIQKVWRDTTQLPVSDDAYFAACEGLIDEVRSINRSLSADARVRIFAGDPPIDWTKIKSTEEFIPFLRNRDDFVAHLIEREVLTKGQLALIVYGAGHVWRKNALNPSPNIASLLDKDYPGKLFTIVRLSGLYPDTGRLESLIATPDRPVLVSLKSVPMGQLDANEFIGGGLPVKLFPEGLGIAEVADACIYTGKTPDTRLSSTNSSELKDPAWQAEQERRRAFMPHARQ